VMDPDARAEPIGVFPSVCHVVLVGEKDMRDAAGVVEPLYEFGRMARRINEEVASRARDEVRVRAEGRARIEPTAPHAIGDPLRKDRRLWPRLPRFAAYRRGWAHEYRTPGRKLFLGCRRLPREDTFAVSLDDEIRCNVARGATIDASGVDVPITRCGVGIASRLHRVFDSLRVQSWLTLLDAPLAA